MHSGQFNTALCVPVGLIAYLTGSDSLRGFVLLHHIALHSTALNHIHHTALRIFVLLYIALTAL